MMAIEINRRRALMLSMKLGAMGLTTLGISALGMTTSTNAWAKGTAGTPLLLSARDDMEGRHWAVAYALDGKPRFSLATDQRCHDIVVHPGRQQALFVARRPGTHCYWIDTTQGQLLSVLAARPQRHFYGHGVFDAEGKHLYLTENDLRRPGSGVIGVYLVRANGFEFSHEISTHGIEPHQLEWDREQRGFITANGGMITEANSRDVRNPEAIASSLVHVGLDGRLISKDTLSDPLCSIRHLAMQADGGIVTAQQYIGNPVEANSHVPLLAVKPLGQPLIPVLMPQAQFMQMQGYLASIAVHPSQPWFATTAPRGNRFLIYDRRTLACIADAHMPDCAGIVAWKQGFLLSSGQGLCRYIELHAGKVNVTTLSLPAGGWDNHLRLG